MFRADLFDGKKFLVTGGASGLGREIAEKYLSLGAEVAICGRRGPLLEEAAAALQRKYARRVFTHKIDIRDYDAVGDMVDRLWAEFGPLDGLVNNAAGNFICRTEDLTRRGFEAVSDIVFRGTFFTTQAVGKRWIAAKQKGSIVSIIVTWVFNAGPFVVPSAMSKSAVATMTRSLAVEWGRYGIRLNAIAPGVFPTEGASKRLRPGEEPGMRVGRINPMGRHGEMPELQNLATFLLAPGCEWLNGETITIDGAQHLVSAGGFYDLREWDDKQWQEARDAIRATNNKDRAARGA